MKTCKNPSPCKLFKGIPVTLGHDRLSIAYLEVVDPSNELDFLSLEHGSSMSSISTHNTYACYVDYEFDGRWAYYVRFPNEKKWYQVW